MANCPACGQDPPPGATACPGCGLPSELFEPIHLIAGSSSSEGRYAEDVRDLLEALGELATPAPTDAPAPSRSEAPGRPAEGPPPARSPLALVELPTRPAEPDSLAEQRRRNQGYLELARELGLDAADLHAEAQRLARLDDAGALDRLGRELFLRIAERLTTRYETLLEHREELARHLPTGGVDTALGEARARLAEGSLTAARGALAAAEQAIDRTEEEWGPVEVLLENAEALAEGVRSFGGDPGGAFGPVVEGKRLARAGDRARAEHVLAAGNLALWTMLHPLVRADLTRRVQTIRTLEAGGHPVGPALAEMHEFGAQLQARNFSAALAAYRRATDWLEPPDGAGPAGPSINSGP